MAWRQGGGVVSNWKQSTAVCYAVAVQYHFIDRSVLLALAVVAVAIDRLNCRVAPWWMQLGLYWVISMPRDRDIDFLSINLTRFIVLFI